MILEIYFRIEVEPANFDRDDYDIDHNLSQADFICAAVKDDIVKGAVNLDELGDGNLDEDNVRVKVSA